MWHILSLLRDHINYNKLPETKDELTNRNLENMEYAIYKSAHNQNKTNKQINKIGLNEIKWTEPNGRLSMPNSFKKSSETTTNITFCAKDMAVVL